MSLSSRNLILLTIAENMIALVQVRRAVLSLFITRNRVVYKEMCLARLVFDAFWDDNVPVIPEFDLVEAERLGKQFFELYKSGVHTTVRNTLRVTYSYVSCQKGTKKNIPSKSI